MIHGFLYRDRNFTDACRIAKTEIAEIQNNLFGQQVQNLWLINKHMLRHDHRPQNNQNNIVYIDDIKRQQKMSNYKSSSIPLAHHLKQSRKVA